jgi:hypothetical protein
MKILIEKLEELPNPQHPNNIEVGYSKIGEFISEPKVGDRFYVGLYWSTSIVTEIIDDKTFKTLNSIYKWSFIDKK